MHRLSLRRPELGQLGWSFLHRSASKFGYTVELNVQYRCHPGFAELICKGYYGGKLKSDDSAPTETEIELRDRLVFIEKQSIEAVLSIYQKFTDMCVSCQIIVQTLTQLDKYEKAMKSRGINASGVINIDKIQGAETAVALVDVDTYDSDAS